jgi:hypothetical protein
MCKQTKPKKKKRSENIKNRIFAELYIPTDYLISNNDKRHKEREIERLADRLNLAGFHLFFIFIFTKFIHLFFFFFFFFFFG